MGRANTSIATFLALVLALLVGCRFRGNYAPVISDDGKLSLYVVPTKTVVHGDEPFALEVTLTNLSDEPLNVMRPCADTYAATCALEIIGAHGRLKYTGPTPTYVLGSGAFGTLQPGDAFTDTFKIPPSNFKGSEAQRDYGIRFTYSAREHDSSRADQYGVDNLWVGEILAEQVIIRRE